MRLTVDHILTYLEYTDRRPFEQYITIIRHTIKCLKSIDILYNIKMKYIIICQQSMLICLFYDIALYIPPSKIYETASFVVLLITYIFLVVLIGYNIFLLKHIKPLKRTNV